MQHHPADGDHLQNGGDFARPVRFHIHFAVEQIKHDRADEDDGVACDDEDRKPDGEPAVVGIGFTPVADAERDDAAEEQTFIGDRIQDNAQPAPLFVTTRHITIETIANRSDQKDQNGGEALPLERFTVFNALAIIDRHRDKRRDHQNPGDGDLVRGGHGLPKLL